MVNFLTRGASRDSYPLKRALLCHAFQVSLIYVKLQL
jgi:hypothetical protein